MPEVGKVELGAHAPIIAQLLWNRSIHTAADAVSFLDPDYGRDVHDPFLFREMPAACERVWRAIEEGEQVVIHGDYDADGVTGSAVLLSTFRAVAEKRGADPSAFVSYIPHREKEGYGVRKATIDLLAEAGATLMLTVDCGIGCADEIAYAREKGIDTIVVDHHQVPERVPECIIIHPWVPGETYPFRYLAAVGVSFKLATAFIRFCAERGVHLDSGFEKWLLDLVSIATVTDVMPLVGENRVLEKYGLLVLNKTRRVGLKKIIEAAGRELGKLDTMDIGFYIGPRINAASRMDHASAALEAIMAENEEEAETFAQRLNDLNRDRQKQTEEIMSAAREQLRGRREEDRISIVCGDGWPAGIVGLVAGKIMNELGIPSFALGRENGKYVGSGRSVQEFNVVVAMEKAKAHLARFGGHPQACGVTIEGDDNYAKFREIMTAEANTLLADVPMGPAVDVDVVIDADEVTWPLITTLAKFEPHGEKNPRPKFLLRGLPVAGVDLVGKTQAHARIGVRRKAGSLQMIGFNIAEKVKGFAPGTLVDAVVELGVNEWNGMRKMEVKIVDVKETAGEAVVA
jgi:single-stranded-DNA-specific exonuclease